MGLTPQAAIAKVECFQLGLVLLYVTRAESGFTCNSLVHGTVYWVSVSSWGWFFSCDTSE